MLMKMLIHFTNHWKHWLFPTSFAGSNPSSPAKSNPLQTQRLQGISFICNGFPSLLCILSVNQNII